MPYLIFALIMLRGGMKDSLKKGCTKRYKECAINPLHIISAFGHCKASLLFLSAFIHGQDRTIFDSVEVVFSLIRKWMCSL